MKKGLSALAKIFVVVITIVFLFIFVNLTNSYIKSKNLEKVISSPGNSTDKDLNYYLPAQFAAIKLTRGYFEANITGVLISFTDDSKTYNYNSTIYPGVSGTKTYTILKDELLPKVPDNWDFTKVKTVYLRYILSNGNPSAIIKTVNINPNQTREDFGEECSSTGEGQVSCE